MIKAIETEYKGYRFRSRLEARWAVFFDAIGAKWEYEPEGYELADGTMYLPDFVLHGVRGRGVLDGDEIYVEIKGVLTPEDLHKVEMFPMPIIIFGQIPDAEWKEVIRENGEPFAYWDFDFRRDHNEHFYNLEFSECDFYHSWPKAGKGGGLVLDYPDDPYDFVDDDLTAEAFKKARQARFEHGEHGAKQKSWTEQKQMDDLVICREHLAFLEAPDQEFCITHTQEEIERMKSECRESLRQAEAEKEIDDLRMTFGELKDPEQRRQCLQRILELTAILRR